MLILDVVDLITHQAVQTNYEIFSICLPALHSMLKQNVVYFDCLGNKHGRIIVVVLYFR